GWGVGEGEGVDGGGKNGGPRGGWAGGPPIEIFAAISVSSLALAGCRRRLRRRNGDGRWRGSRRHAGGGGRACVFARGPGVLAAGEHERQNDDDEDGACNPSP